MHSLQAFGGYQNLSYELSGAGEPKQINAARISAGALAALGVMPVTGRLFSKEEDEGAQPLTLLSYGLWIDRYHRDPNILGAKVLLDRKPYIEIGVMPRGFEFPLNPGRLNRCELWVPLSLSPKELTAAAANWTLEAVGRLKAGVSAAQAQGEAHRVAQEIMRTYPKFMSSLRIEPQVRGLQEATVKQARPLLRILFLAVIVVLLLVCANLAGLLLVRTLSFRRDNAVRLALGAHPKQIVAQTLVESLTLSVTGGAIGIVFSAALIQVLSRVLPETMPLLDQIHLNGTVAAAGLALAIVTGLICGLAPALAASRTHTNEALKEGGRTGSTGGGQARLRSGLVAMEIAIALVLVTASGLLLRSFERMRITDPGFRPQRVLTALYSLPQQRYSTQAAVNAFSDELPRRLRQLPGVTDAGMISILPMSVQSGSGALVIENYIAPKGAGISLAQASYVIGDPFRALGIRLLRGRLFDDHDRDATPLVTVVNRKLAQHYWPGQNPVGKRFRVGFPESPTPWITVVGEMADVRQASRDVEASEQYYQPARQMLADFGGLAPPPALAGDGGAIVLRSTAPWQVSETAVRATVQSIDPQLALDQMQPMEQVLSNSEAPRRFNTALISGFAAMALLLAALGIYSVTAFSVALRRREFAIRMALGSQKRGIFRLVIVSGLRLAVLGIGVGLVGYTAWRAYSNRFCLKSRRLILKLSSPRLHFSLCLLR